MPQHTIGVSVRVRPPPAGEDGGHDGLLSCHRGWVSRVVEGSDQTESYSALGEELVTMLRGGYSCTLLAYGQTGSGKTYTMFGPTGCLTESALAAVPDGGVPDAWGIFPRVVSVVSARVNNGVHHLYFPAMSFRGDSLPHRCTCCDACLCLP